MRMSGSPRLLLILSMVAFGTVALVVRRIPLPSGEIALWRAVLAAAALLLYTRFSGQPLRRSQLQGAWRLVLSGALMGFNWVALFEAYRFTSISVATLTYYLAPLLVTALSALLLKERMTRLQVVCLFLSLLGLALIIDLGRAGGSNILLGVLFGLLSAVLYASVVMVNRFVQGVSGVHRTLVQFLAAIAVLLPYNLLRGELQLFHMPVSGWPALLLLGLLHTGTMYCLYFAAIQHLKGHEIAILSYIDPLVALLCSALFLGERMGLLQVVGGLIILASSYVSGRAVQDPRESV